MRYYNEEERRKCMTLGQLLKQERTNACLTQKELSKELMISVQSISCYERDAITPALNILKRYSQFFKIDTKVLAQLRYEQKNKTRNK